MCNQFFKKTFVFFSSVLFIFSPAFFAAAQSDGSAAPADSGVADTSDLIISPTETAAVPAESLPRAAPVASTSPPADVVAPVRGDAAPPVSPRPTKASPAPTQTPPPVSDDEQGQTFGAPEGLSLPADAEGSSSFPYALVALAVVLVAAPYGMARMLSQNRADKNEEKDNKCDQIKNLLERKKSTLEIITGTISVKQALVDLLLKKIEDKKEELKDEVTAVVIDEVAGEEGGKIIRSAKEAKDAYDDLVEQLEQAKRALEYFNDKRQEANADVDKIESAYQVCLLGNSVFEGASGLSRGLEIFEDELHQKLYRYVSDGKDVFSRDGALANNLAEMAEAGKWLPSPNLSDGGQSGNLRFFLTEKGKEEYEKTLFLLHKKYLPGISCEEAEFSDIDGIVYEDEWQVVVRKKTS